MPILSYDCLLLTNGGSEGIYNIRNRLVARIAKDAGFRVAYPVSCAAVFLNGEYYGFVWLYARMDNHFLEDLYNAPQRDFDVVDTDMYSILEQTGIFEERDQINQGSLQGYADETIELMESLFDVENLLLYHAIQIYTGNDDWFIAKNLKYWRYTGLFHEQNAPELDGRWRFIPVDNDMTLGSNDRAQPDARTIHTAIDRFPHFHALIQRPENAEKLSTYICDMMTEHFSTENLLRVMQELNEMSLAELEYAAMLRDVDLDEAFLRRPPMFTFTDQRPDYMLAELREIFGYTEMYRIISDGTVKINTLNGNEGTYFVENRVPVTPLLEKGHMFDHWLVNGEKRYEEDLLISFGDADADGVVFVQAVSREDFPPLFFKDTYDTGALYGFTMYNPNGATQNTRGLYLSDDIFDLKKWQFPNLNIRSGSTWEFVGRNSTSLDSLLKIGLNFNPRHGEVIFLSSEDGEILDWIAMMP